MSVAHRSSLHRRALLVLVLVVLAVAGLGAADARAADPTGTYVGTHKDYDYGDCVSCLDLPAAVKVEPAGGNTFTVFYFRDGVAGSTATCGTGSFQLCIRYTATFDGATGVLTGTGVRDPGSADLRDLPFSATLSGDTLTGRADWELGCDGSGGSGCYYAFSVAREGTAPPPPDPPATAITAGPPSPTEADEATFTFATTESSPPPGSFECSLDGGPFTPCGSPRTVSGLSDGAHEFAVRYRTDEGVTGPAATRIWKVEAPPIIFLPGFLGSRIVCGGSEVWPRIPDGLPRPLAMRLREDGVTDVGARCTVPSSVPGLVQSIPLGPTSYAVYGDTLEFLRRIAPSRTNVFAWDWRKSPQEALAALDDLIDRVRSPGGKVVLMGHSMGGLTMRWYLDDPARAAKVARAVAVGTPFHGSPKSFFPLATGTASPAPSGIDALLDNDEMQQFARNLQGLYFLWPSPAFGSWLTVTGRGDGPLDLAGQRSFATALGGNARQLRRAHDDHRAHLDTYPAGSVDLHVVAGTAVNTPLAVRVTPLPAGLGLYDVQWGSGDGTVPARSARLGSAAPRTKVHTVCGVGHVPLPGDPAVTSRLRDFLLEGDPISGAECDRPASGSEIYIPLQGLASGAAIRAHDAQARELTVDEVERRGLVEVVDVPGARIVATNADSPVTLSVSGRRLALRVTPLRDGAKGTPRFYPATDGRITIAAAPAITVSARGRPIAPLARRDRSAPVTRVSVRRRGGRLVLRFTAADASGVAATTIRIGTAKERRVQGQLTVSAAQLRSLRFRSVDVYGNVERWKRAR